MKNLKMLVQTQSLQLTEFSASSEGVKFGDLSLPTDWRGIQPRKFWMQRLCRRRAAYFDILTVRVSERFFFCLISERWWRWVQSG